jgi:hypothetical protein
VDGEGLGEEIGRVDIIYYYIITSVSTSY